MSENSREEEKLSFKEQILRDLERLKREDGIANTKSSNDDLFSNLSNSSEAEKAAEEPSVEDLMANSVSLVDELLANAPAVPPRPVLQDDSYKHHLLWIKQNEKILQYFLACQDNHKWNLSFFHSPSFYPKLYPLYLKHSNLQH